MQRPRPNPRRGLVRAVAAVIVLIAILVGILAVVSLVSAPPAKAPAVPRTPTVTTSPSPLPSPLPTVPPTATKHAKKTKTATSSKGTTKSSLGAIKVQDVSGAGIAVTELTRAGVPSPNGRYLAYFRGAAAASDPSPLIVLNRTTGRTRIVGAGDSLVRPIWSPNSRALLYVTVRAGARFPHALWSLRRTHVTGEPRQIARQSGMTMTPLGWSGSHILYALGTAAGSYLYAAGHGFVSILFPQITTGASLSPDGRTIAFAVHTNCGWCTVDLFSVETHKVRFGPSGAPTEIDLAWSHNGATLATLSRGHVALVDSRTGVTRYYRRPPGLPLAWRDPMALITTSHVLWLANTVTGERYRVV